MSLVMRKVDKIREAVVEYIRTEGCGCCSDYDGHKAAADKLGALLGFPRYDDDSGVNFFGDDDEQKESD